MLEKGAKYPRSQALPRFLLLLPYCKQQKAGWGLGTRLGAKIGQQTCRGLGDQFFTAWFSLEAFAIGIRVESSNL